MNQANAVLVALVPVLVVWLVCVAWTTFDMGGAWFALAVAAVPVAIAGALTTPAMTQRWALDRGAAIVGPVVDLVHRQVLRARVARTLGITLAIATQIMVTAYYNAHLDSFAENWDRWSAFERAGGVWGLAAVGYTGATVAAEATKPRLAGAGRVAAVLDRRRLGDLLDVGLRRVLVVYLAVAGLAATAWSVVFVDSGSVSPSPAAVFPLLVAVAALVAATWASRRRQRAADDQELAYDELTRTSAVNALAGTSVGMLGVFAGLAGSAAWDADSGWLAFVGFAYMLLGFGVWIASGTKLVFRTRRIDALRAAA